MSKVFIEDTTLTAIGNAIRGKTGTSDLIDPANMAQEITNLPTGGSGGGIDPSVLAFTGDLQYFNYNGTLDNLLTTYGAQCNFTDVNNLFRAFNYANKSEYSITIFGNLNNTCDISHCFENCGYLEQLPPMKNIKPRKIGNFLTNCPHLTTIPDDYADTWDFTYLNTTTNGDSGAPMANCYRLRKAPKFIKYIYNLNTSISFNPYRGVLNHAWNIDEIIGYPCPPANFTSNVFSYVSELNRIKDFTFDMLDENTPYTRNWKSQTIDFANTYIGYSNESSHQRGYFDQIGEYCITDDASYQLLKDNPNSWTTDPAYSRYNHDSAVRTIKSLPDCSAAGGTNTITFKGSSGSKTDSGAINTLTEEEIAVATAKGWTVSLV